MIYDVLSLLYLWWAQKTCSLLEILTRLIITRGLKHHKFSIFDGKQHPKKIWFRGCYNHPWLLFLISFLTPFQWFLAMSIFSGESDLGPVSYLNHDWNKPHEECKTISQPFKRLGDNCPHWFVLSMNLNDSYDSDCESLLF